MIWRIDVFSKEKHPCLKIALAISDLGIAKPANIKTAKVYLIEADFDLDKVKQIASCLLIDPVTEDYSLIQGIFKSQPKENQILITYNPGVCDSVGLSLEKAARELSLEVKNARTASFFEFEGLSRKDIEYLAPRMLYNPLIEHLLEYTAACKLKSLDEFSGSDYNFNLITVELLSADDQKLQEISKKGCLSLSLDEMKIIQGYFKRFKRNPTDCELETVATLWSEHCAHKTFRGLIEYVHKDSQDKIVKQETIKSLLKSTVMKATKDISSPDCVSVFEDNSGIVKFDDKNNICFKVETHNHPSSLEPYGGASTGIGGVIRDILGTGCAAKPFASVDIFCFSPWQMAHDQVPLGLLHPKRIIKGVVKGVRDYGNRMGIPTVAGAVLFDQRFLGNPLVYCGTLGILPKEKSFKKSKPGDLVILCGAKTGRDGIHGATFSSKELDEHTVGLTTAVQVGNPIEEKKLTEAILRARDKNLFTAITDCGAGGISSAITELASEHGVKVDLEKIPLKYRGISYTEIWISESQERMVFFTSPQHLKELEAIFNEEDVGLTVVGEVTDTHKLELFYQGNRVCDLDLDFIFNLPQLKKKAFWKDNEEEDLKLEVKSSYSQDLEALLGRPNIACKDWVIREYDHEVQAGSVTKAVSGIENIALSDAAVSRPDLGSDKAVVIGFGINPFYSDLDPYWMAALAIDEALRNIVACGGDPDKTFILDNFSWGSPADELVLGSLVRASLGCYDFATYYRTPFISGKDSLYNEYDVRGKHISIPGTLLISAMSVISDWRKAKSNHFRTKDNLIYVLGFSRPELGASEYFRSLDIKKGLVPKVDKKIARDIFKQLSQAIEGGLTESCHDCSEGGLAVSVSEMCIGGDLGANIFLAEVPKAENMFDYEILFSESPTRFIVEVKKENQKAFESALAGLPLGLIGCVCDEKKLVIYNHQQKEVVNSQVEDLRRSWMATFGEFR
ncbi:MAG: phosphoribosylformylglycinamidine synthase subunit PurL [Candidatus Omnitrophica bacterium]|nr:phosphoribosylformylglycinamidine synthase subunit PurL [Candidatus Omnitrophota bacterium]